MPDLPYPHTRNDCYCCGEFDADMMARYEGLVGADLRWCQRCAGPQLTRFVLAGHIVTVLPVDDDAGSAVHHSSQQQWTVDLAEKVIRLALPDASKFLRALINEGGRATAERLRELTDREQLHHMTRTLNFAARKLAGAQLDRPRLVQPGRDPDHPRRQKVYDYELPAALVPIFDEALRRLGR